MDWLANSALTGLASSASSPVAASDGPGWLALIPGFPLLAAALCGLMLAMKIKSKLPAWTTVAALAGSFIVAITGFLAWRGAGMPAQAIHLWDWFDIRWGEGNAQSFIANFALYMDGLSWLWMLFVTGLATLIALYASEYMAGDKGYARFFAYFGLFVVSMSMLVMADNLIVLYLGWEGVGLCSYLLIGYFYKKPAAVAAAKKAFIVNRIGDLGLALGIFLTYTTFGTVQYAALFDCIANGTDAAGNALALTGMWQAWTIPLLLTLAAFGKSAQFPLYVWLPDAMEGPTPVSALIHAATMVTAGVYLIARMYPLFALDGVPHIALTVVAWTGTFTALLAATIGMAQFDIKRIMAYSTVSQLGFMFAGLGVLTTVGSVYHVLTHAFFKATLFLACGAVMHGMAGQLDLRKLSGLWHMPGWKVVSIAMLVGCLNLAGVPIITAGYFSKDMILAEAFVTPGFAVVGLILLFTAGLTAYYTFRVFYRVFLGPQIAEPGDEDHGGEEEASGTGHQASGEDDHGHGHGDDHGHGHSRGHGHFHPHPPGLAINFVLATLAVLSFAAIPLYFMKGPGGEKTWVGGMLAASSAHYVTPYGHHGHDEHSDDHHAASPTLRAIEGVAVIPAMAPEAGVAAEGHSQSHNHAQSGHAEAGTFFGLDPHKAMYFVSGIIGALGILAAAYFHAPPGWAGFFLGNRRDAAHARSDAVAARLGPIPHWAERKWFVDELYDAIVRIPLKVLAHICSLVDKLLVDGVVNLFGAVPRTIANTIRPAQGGVLHGYAAGMAGGIAIVLVVVWILAVR